jgi:hypothetical protein
MGGAIQRGVLTSPHMARNTARTRPLADLIDACLGPALRAQGFAAADILVAWSDIVGQRLAEVTQPVRLEWPRRRPTPGSDARPDPATLVVRVEGAFALEMQHLAPLLIERVNVHYGWRCVGRLVLKQGPVRRARQRVKAAPTMTDEERQRLATATAGVAEDGLRAALERLGTAVTGARTGSGTSTKP